MLNLNTPNASPVAMAHTATTGCAHMHPNTHPISQNMHRTHHRRCPLVAAGDRSRKAATAVTAATAGDGSTAAPAASLAAPAAPAAEATQQEHDQQQQWQLTESNMQEFIDNMPQLAALFGGSQGVQAKQLFDGVINMVFQLQGSSGQLAIVKQALPYVRAVGESFPLSRERMDVEAAAMQLLHSCCPAHIPQLYAYDPAQSILAMQCAPPPHQKLLYCIRQGQILPGLDTQLAELLAAYLSHTSLQLKSPDEQQALISQFANRDIVEANERVVLLSPFTPGDSTNRWSSPQLDGDVQAMWSDSAVMSSAAAMLQLYRQQKESLIHNDLHAGNLLVAPGSLFLIDWEFGTFGPVAFDVGCLLGNLALAVLSLKGMHEFEAREQQDKQHKQLQQPQSQSQHTRREQAEWLLQVMNGTWAQFLQHYTAKLSSAAAAASTQAAAAAAAAAAQDVDVLGQQRLLADSCGFAGCCLIRLTVGIHHYPDIQSIQDTDIRVAVERACLQLGQQLLLLRAAYHEARSSSGSGSSSATSGDSAAARLEAVSGVVIDRDSTLAIELVQQLVRRACGSWLS